MRLAQVDFLRAPLQPRAGWVLLAAGVVLLAAASWCGQRWATERSDALRVRQEAQAALAPKPAPVLSPQARLAERRQRQAMAELKRPWLPAWQAIEAATQDPVYLLSLSIEPDAGLIKLEGEAPSFDQALAYVQVLDIGGALQPAFLASHAQPVPQRTAQPVVRFSVTTHWNSR